MPRCLKLTLVGSNFQVGEDKLWGFCSESCSVNYTMPSTYHEQVLALFIDWQNRERCKKMKHFHFGQTHPTTP